MAQQSVTITIPLVFVNLVAPKAGAEQELLFNKLRPDAGLLNTRSCLAAALGATEFMTVIAMILVTLCCAA